jgi:hypothetical protein
MGMLLAFMSIAIADDVHDITIPGEAVGLPFVEEKDHGDKAGTAGAEARGAQVHTSPPSGATKHFFLFCREELKHTSCDLDQVEHEMTDCLDCARKYVSTENKHIIDRHNKCTAHKIASFCAPAVHEFFHPSKPAIPQISETEKAQNMLRHWAHQSRALCVTEMLHSTCDSSKVEGLVPCLKCADTYWDKVHAPHFAGETFCKEKSQLVKFCNEKELKDVEADEFASSRDAAKRQKSRRLLLLGAAGLGAACIVFSQSLGHRFPGTVVQPPQQLEEFFSPSDKKRRSLTDIEQVNYATETHEAADRSARAAAKPMSLRDEIFAAKPDTRDDDGIDRRPSCL